MTVTYKKEPLSKRRIRERWSQTSASNTAQTCTTDPSASTRAFAQPKELKSVTVQWDAAVTKDCTVTLNSGAGTVFDVLLATMSITTGKSAVYLPAKPVSLMSDDRIDVYCPAGGSGRESSITIVTELDEL